MKTYEIALSTDSGDVVFRVGAKDIQSAQTLLLSLERAPVSAVKWWRVVPTAKQIRKTKSLMHCL